MNQQTRSPSHFTATALVLLGTTLLGRPASAAAEYHPIALTMSDKTITLTGHDLTIEQVVQVARYGAKVQLSREARQRELDTYGLMNEAATEGVPVYLFNRGGGGNREVPTFAGDPLSPENRPKLEARSLAAFNAGATRGYGPEIDHEDVVRAMMVVRANQMTYLAASPQLMQMMLDLINADITPVVWSRGGTGEALGAAPGNINATMVGAGEAYLHGVRMPASEALQKAHLTPIKPAPGDSTLTTVNVDVTGMSALLVYDARQLLDWDDLVLAMDMEGLNSNPTRLFPAVQANRPFPWLNWQAARVLDMLKGSYLFNVDLKRIIQDAESMEGSPERQGSAWRMWGVLRDDVTIQMNWSDHNPAVIVGLSPADSWELSTSQAMRYYVKGGPESNGKHGYVLSNTNWDPNPLGNDVEAFTIALANTAVAVMLRQERFNSTFFTVVSEQEILGGGPTGPAAPGAPAAPPAADGLTPGAGAVGGGGHAWSNHEVWQRIQGLINPVPPEGYGDARMVEELDAETLFKVPRASEAVDEMMMLLAGDLATGARWMDIRKLQDPSRYFGAAPTAAWQAFRKVSPLQPAAGQSAAVAALAFMKANPASTFYSGGPAMPGSDLPSEMTATKK
jgi:histidine ammonia-lyase